MPHLTFFFDLQKYEQKDEILLLVALYSLVTVKAIFIFLLPASYGAIVNQKSKLSGSLCEGLTSRLLQLPQ